MLTELSIRDLAIIENLSLDLGPGLTVLTGETGAGKSIILGALNLLLGERASTDDLRAGAQEAEVTGRLDVRGHGAAERMLAREGLGDSDEPGTVLIRRVIAREGRSRCWVNGRPVPVSTVKGLGDLLVDLHGQHQHQSLLSPGRHREVLDEFGGHGAELRSVAEAHGLWSDVRAARRRLEGDARELDRRRDFLLHQIREVRATRLCVGELEALEAERRRLTHAEALMQAAAHGAERLQEGEEVNALGLLAEVRSALERVADHDAELAALVPRLEEAEVTLSDVARELASYAGRIEVDPARLDAVEERIAEIRKILRRHGRTEAEVLALAKEWRREAETIESRDAELERLVLEEARRAGELADAALRLHTARERAATKLGLALVRELRDVAMERVQIEVLLQTTPDEEGVEVAGHGRVRADETGMDAVEFLFSANPGEPPRPLARIASGGELSRLMLALKAVAAGRDHVPTLVFDEVDVGIGGQTAGRVAEKMARLAERHQILCITHLPQIAARATTHLGVTKRTRSGRTVTEVLRLGRADRVDALALLISGDAGGTARRSAEEMLDHHTQT